MRTTVPITAKQRRKLECPGLALESALVDDGSPETLVMVYRIDPLRQIRGTTQSIVKFSASEFAIPNAERLQLGTHRYYREYGGAGTGVRDDMEARFQEDMTDTLLKRMGLLGQWSSFSAKAKMSVDDQWIFCTSVLPTGAVESTSRRLGKRFGYQCGTRILDPATFAQELGVVFAATTSWADVRLAGYQKTLQLLASVKDISRTVFVYHGPVSYPSDATKVVRSFPEHHQPAIVPFQKPPEFWWQQEYRFTIGFQGEPKPIPSFFPSLQNFAASPMLYGMSQRASFDRYDRWRSPPPILGSTTVLPEEAQTSRYDRGAKDHSSPSHISKIVLDMLSANVGLLIVGSLVWAHKSYPRYPAEPDAPDSIEQAVADGKLSIKHYTTDMGVIRHIRPLTERADKTINFLKRSQKAGYLLMSAKDIASLQSHSRGAMR